MQGRGALKRELVACLRTGRALRVPRARTRQRRRTFVSPEIMISQRPAEADDRAVPGHWEGDLIIGLRSSAIGTLVERTTRFTMLLHLPPMPGHRKQQRVHNGPPLAGHGAQAVRDAIAASIITLPQQLRRSQTLGPRRRNGPTPPNSAQRPTSTSTSATPKVHGSVEPTRTPTVCSANTSPKAPTSTDTHATTSTLSLRHSTADPAKPSTGRPPPRPSTNTYTPSNKAVLQRPLEPGQYLSIRYTNRLTEAGIEPSVGSVGDSYDNALAESVIGLYKTELIHKRAPWKDLDQIEYATLEYVDWFNHRRLLEPIGDIPPAEKEANYHQEHAPAPLAGVK